MELCSIEDAFPNIEMERGISGSGGGSGSSGFPYVGGTDSRPTKEERRAARKKAKRCKAVAPGPATYLEAFEGGGIGAAPATDPDRPAAKRMPPVESFQGVSGAAAPDDLLVPVAKQKAMLPILPKASCLYSDPGYPSYFGKGEDDDEDDDAKEGFASYSAATSGPQPDDATYRLQPDFLKTFQLQGAQKAGGLPAPNINDSWKPMATGMATYTAFGAGGGPDDQDPVGPGKADQAWALSFLEPVSAPRPAAPVARRVENPRRQAAAEVAAAAAEEAAARVVPAGGNPKEDRDVLLARIDTLMGRIDALERKKSEGQDTQKELLMFIGGGLALLLSFQLIAGGGRRR
jgi:hypothetical protein